MDLRQQIAEAVAAIQKQTAFKPQIGIILGDTDTGGNVHDIWCINAC